MLDYRETLRKELQKRAALNKTYSLRAFARDLKVSPSRLSEILAKKNGLSQVNALRIARSLELTPRDQDGFLLSVLSQHSRNPAERRKAIRKLDELKASSPKKVLHQDEFRVVADWYHYGILELLNLKNFELSPVAVAAQLKISKTDAFAAIERLKNLGWIRKVNSRWVSDPEYRVFSSNTPSLALRKFHSQLVRKAEEAIHQQEMSERILQSLVLTTTPERIQEAGRELSDFCYKFNQKYGSKYLEGETLYALTLQFFRLNTQEDL